MTNEPENLRTREPEDFGDDPLADLRRELQSVEPSPAFAAGVRERIEIEKEGRARAAWFLDWRFIVTVSAAVIIAAAINWDSNTSNDHGGANVRADDGADVRADGGADVRADDGADNGANGGANTSAAGPVSARPNVRVARGVSPVNAMNVAQEQPLDVITQQPEILRRLWEQYRAAELALAAAQPLPVGVRDVVVVPVEVEPVIVKWLVEPPDAASGSVPIIRRLTAERAERSAK